MFDHVQIKVRDLAKSRVFYEAVLGVFGYAVVFEDGGVVGFGTSTHDMFEISAVRDDALLSAAVHVAFSAPSEEMVRAFHKAALEHGGKDNGAPGFRPEYEVGYFAAFVIDLDGHNIEVVYQA